MFKIWVRLDLNLKKDNFQKKSFRVTKPVNQPKVILKESYVLIKLG